MVKARGVSTILLLTLVCGLVLLLVFFLAVMFSVNPAWAFRLFGTCEKLTILEFVGVGMGGFLLAIGALIANRRAIAMEMASRHQARANLNVEQGQRQERLRNAIEHLGNESPAVRLGGAYELFHLARDTEELRGTVLDILCGHIRQMTNEIEYQENHKSKPSVEIQSLLNLLFRKPHVVFKGLRADLYGSWLKGAGLRSARLIGAGLSGAKLQSSYLRYARLQGAILAGANLQLADLRHARLQGAVLQFAEMQVADMVKAGLQGASLTEARLQSAELSGMNLQGAKNMMAEDLEQFPTFVERIRGSIGEDSDLSVVVHGGLTEEEVDSFANGVPDVAEARLREKLEHHIGRAPKRLSTWSGPIFGSYTEKEAEEWIAEYKEWIFSDEDQ